MQNKMALFKTQNSMYGMTLKQKQIEVFQNNSIFHVICCKILKLHTKVFYLIYRNLFFLSFITKIYRIL